MIRRILAIVVALSCLVLAANSFAQTGSGQVGGIVQDSTKALVPGVNITLTNTATGVVNTQVSNETGAYNFVSVPPGNYKVTAELPGFKLAVANDLKVGPNAQVRWDFTLEVGAVNSAVEVSVTADQLQTESTASVGVTLPEQRIRDLPIVGQNVIDLIGVLPGYRLGPTAATATVGGLGLDTVNATINGLSTNSSRDAAQFWGPQTFTTNVINPDLVGEVRLIIAPVDAELGRGNAQFQIQTRGGTNQFHGSAVLDLQNSSFNANTWANNRTTAVVNGKTVWSPTRANWYNLQQYTGSIGGPIKKNKTFFFFLYDQQEVFARDLITNQVFTDAARQGIFRYWSGWNPGDALAPYPTSFTNSTTGTYPSVDFNGNPLRPANNPDGTPYTGNLYCFSVFGTTKMNGAPFTQADCPGGEAVNHSPWDPYRLTPDQTGYIKNLISLMPPANFFANFNGVVPDGLNTAIQRYVRHRRGSSSTNASIGVVSSPADYNNRKQSNLKFDHNFNSKHRVSVGWTYEHADSESSLAAWDGKINGATRRRPELITINGTSTLRPTIVNESRFGVNYSSEWASPAWSNLNNPETNAQARTFLLSGGKSPNGKTYPIIYNPGTGANGIIAFGGFDFANTSPLWNYADTLRWTKGKHAFSAGGEYRRPMTTGFNSSAYSTSTGGNATASTAPLMATLSNYATELPGFLQTARTNSTTLLYLLNGSIATAATPYWIDNFNDVKSGVWRDTTVEQDIIHTGDPDFGHQARTQISNEWSFFFKDDYKIAKRLTLNIGVRYDYNLSPYLRGGLTNRFVGDGSGLFGAGRPTSGDLFTNWLQPGNLYLTGYGSNPGTPLACQKGVQQSPLLPASTCDPTLMSTLEFVGPGSPNPKDHLVPQSGRIGPAVGFAWQVPWFGDGKTTMRGGFQRTYGTAGSTFSGGLVSGPGGDGTNAGITVTDAAIAQILQTRALNIGDLPKLIPARPTRAPGVAIPVAGRLIGVGYSMYDANYVTPYTDNFTWSINRTLSRNLTLDVRFIDTIGKKLPGTGGSLGTPGSFDINTANVYHNPELFKALEATRAGNDDPLFDQMLMGLNLNPTVAGYGQVGTTVNNVLQRGSAQIRRAFAANLANGNYAGVVASILGFVPTVGTGAGQGGAQALPIDPATGATVIAAQRITRNGCDRIANGLTNGFTIPGGATILPRCFAENYFVANPQLTTANYAGNFGRTNYQSFETGITLRPTMGMSVQATYSFSKTMSQPGSGYTDPLNRSLDYGKASSSGGHELRANGTVELPIGPNKLLFRNTSGFLARALEKWQVGFILNLPYGLPRSLSTANNFLYANGRPDVVGPWDNPKGSVEWKGDNGYFFGTDNPYVPFTDPQCAQRVGGADGNGFSLQTNCTLRGLAKVVPSGTAGAIDLGNGKFGIPVLQNPLPGHQGTLGSNSMFTFSKWTLDGNVSKSFKITESKQFQVRVDAVNILNHPWPADPIGLGVLGTNFSSDNFGQITTKGGNVNNLPRTFQAKLRFSF